MIASRLVASLRLAACLGIIAFTWLVVFPGLGRLPPLERHVRTMEECGVNPAAMVYTELESIPVCPGWADSQLVLWP